MNTFDTYRLVKQASAMFNPHQRHAMQIGRMFERTKGKSQSSQAILSSSKGPMSMNDIAMKKEQEKFDKDQKTFDKDRQSFEAEHQQKTQDLAEQQKKHQAEMEAQQKEVAALKEDLEHQQTLLKRQKELDTVTGKAPEVAEQKPDLYSVHLNNHSKASVKRFRGTLERLLSR